METAVSTVLAGNQLTAWDAFGAWQILAGFKPSRRTAPQAAGAPHSRRNLWQPQVAIFTDFVDGISVSWAFLGSFSFVKSTKNGITARPPRDRL